MICTSCQTVQEIQKVNSADRSEQLMDPALMGERAHRWAKNLQQVTCGQCGSVILRSQAQQADRCPYCASNRLVVSQDQAELIPPQVIAPMALDEKTALKLVPRFAR